MHVVGVFASTLAHVSLVIARRASHLHLGGGIDRVEWGMEARGMFFLNFDWEMMTYWAIVGVSHALRYHYESQDRALRASRLETRLMEAQLQTLQRQLQPHFLFNTLNTISALMHRDVEAADAMLARLGDLLRLSFETLGVQEVALGQELDFLGKYVDIEQARFRERLDGDLRHRARRPGLPVPNLLLQPLVENAIRHGIGPRIGPGHVLVRAMPRRFGAGTGSAGRRRRRAGLAAVRSRTGRRAVEHPVAAGASLRRPSPLRGAAAGRRRDCRW